MAGRHSGDHDRRRFAGGRAGDRKELQLLSAEETVPTQLRAGDSQRPDAGNAQGQSTARLRKRLVAGPLPYFTVLQRSVHPFSTCFSAERSWSGVEPQCFRVKRKAAGAELPPP